MTPAAAGGPRTAVEIDVGDRRVRLTTLDRVLFPTTGFTKGNLLDYYAHVAPVLMPHMAGRPLTLHRFPEGVEGPHFFQTRCPPHPSWVRSVDIHWPRTGKTVEVCVLDDVAGLLWAANLATIELHPYLARVPRLDEPDAVVFDLDPGPPAGLVDAARVACRIREVVDAAGLLALVKTSGALGLHVWVPLAPGHSYDETKRFARAVAALLAREAPARVIDRMARAHRAGRVFIDWSQNDPGKSTIAPYSLRGLAVPTVATPVTWDEVEAAVAADDAGRLAFGPGDVLARVAEHGDLFGPALTGEQRLPTVPT